MNLFDFTYLMYRPLYWFGTGVQPALNTSLSLASAPVFSGRNVTIKLNNYKWSNGSPVTAQDVMFWINMDRAVPQDWFDYSPGAFPANVSNIKGVSSNELTMTLKKTYSSYWFLYNELSQITPMPAAWDRTASGPSNCDTTVSDCAAVYSYLAAQAKDLDTYATNPTWAIVDGPWKLSAFNADGHITFVPNKSYSGPVKPKLAAFQEVPFTTDAAEYDVLQSPSSSTKIDVGLPAHRGRPGQAGERRRRHQPAGLEGLHAGAAVHLGVRLLRHELPGDRRQRPGPPAAVHPAGAGLPDEPEGNHPGPNARVRCAHRRPSRQHAGEQVPVAARQGRDQLSRGSVPVQHREGQGAADQPRLDGRRRRGPPPAPIRPSAGRGSPRARP